MAYQPQQRKNQKHTNDDQKHTSNQKHTSDQKHTNDQKWNVDVIEHVDATGSMLLYERYEGIVTLADINHGDRYKVPCEGCPKYGKNLSCPPYSPSFLHYIQGAHAARVICLRVPTGYFEFIEERYRSCFRMARDLLVNDLLKQREAGYLVAGSGACSACKVCAVEEGDQSCKKPMERIYSLESLGVNVISLVKRCFDIDLAWSGTDYIADFVSAVGAVFLPQGNTGAGAIGQ
ncbi:MAG: DUF2284 domain-containing protein [bacterium]